MSLMPFALILGILAGLVTGGRFSNLGERSFSLWPLLLGGAVLQVAAQSGALGDSSHLLVAASFALLAVFAASNLRYAGMGVILVGLLMNVATVGANRGMPVQASSIVAAGIVNSPTEVAALDLKAKRHVMTSADHLYWLSDIIPVRLLGGQVLSFGDLVMCIGVVDLVANLLHPFPRRRRARTGRDTKVPDSADDDPDDEVLDLRLWESASPAEVRA
jgi:hypothetical protein